MHKYEAYAVLVSLILHITQCSYINDQIALLHDGKTDTPKISTNMPRLHSWVYLHQFVLAIA